MSLEELIRETMKRGELNYLSVIASASGEYRATYSPASTFGHFQAADRDPVKAITEALKAGKARKRRAPETDDSDDFG